MHRIANVVRTALAAALLVCASAPLSAQSPDKGKLLVATDDMLDPAYQHTVVLLLHHDSNGSIGVAINRPTWVAFSDVEPDIGAIEGLGDPVFLGGPLAPTQVIFLVRQPPIGAFDAPPILGQVYASGNLDQLQGLVDAVGSAGIRLYAGHSEWAAGQLAREIAAGQWKVVDTSAERVFDTDPALMWQSFSTRGSDLLVLNVGTSGN